MKVRKEALILAAAIIGLSLYLIFDKQDRSLYELPRLEPIPVAEISKIRLAGSEEPIVLSRKAGNWVVNAAAYPGDEAKIKRVAERVADLKLTTLISESKAYERYELDDDHKIAVQVWQAGKLVREFDVGKTAPSRRHTFVKLAGDHRVYHAGENLRSQLAGNVDAFRDKTVMAYEAGQIDRVRILSNDGEQVFTRVDEPADTAESSAENTPADSEKTKTRWRDSDGRPVDGQKLARLIDDMAKLTCQAYIYDRSKSDFSNPVATLTLEGAETYSLSLFAKTEDSEYPAVSSHCDDPFLLSGWRGDQVVNFLSDLQPDEGEPPAEN